MACCYNETLFGNDADGRMIGRHEVPYCRERGGGASAQHNHVMRTSRNHGSKQQQSIIA